MAFSVSADGSTRRWHRCDVQQVGHRGLRRHGDLRSAGLLACRIPQVQPHEVGRRLALPGQQQVDQHQMFLATPCGGRPIDDLAVLHEPAQPVHALEGVSHEDIAREAGDRFVRPGVLLGQLGFDAGSQLLGECGQLIRRLVAGLSMPDWPEGARRAITVSLGPVVGLAAPVFAPLESLLDRLREADGLAFDNEGD